jgi:Ca2+-binding EF-hand superfamily protein
MMKRGSSGVAQPAPTPAAGKGTKDVPAAGRSGSGSGAKPAASKPFNADDYVTMTLPKEEVIDIKQAFEIFDADGSGVLDPAELKQAFIDLGFTGQNKFVYQILAELDEDQSGGIDFGEFLRLATAKIGEKDSRVEINKVFNAFDPNRCVRVRRSVGEVHRAGAEEGRPGPGRGRHGRGDPRHDQTRRPRRRRLRHHQRLLQHYDPPSLLAIA